MVVEHRGGPGQRTGGPVGVVVGQRDVRGGGALHAQVARGGTAAALEGRERDGGKVRGDHRGGVVARRVVDHEDGGRLGQGPEAAERPAQQLGAVARGDDDADPRVIGTLRDWSVAVWEAPSSLN